MDQTELKAEFEQRGPWITRFTIDGETYGGFFDAPADPRVQDFFRAFPKAETILELGSLEGGHTLALSRNPAVKRVLGLEARDFNIQRALFVRDIFEVKNIEFAEANLETCTLSDFGTFDVIFCSGLLYHLPEPSKLVSQFSGVSKNLFLSTHYAKPGAEIVERNGYRGMMYQEGVYSDPLSGMSEDAFWPTLEDLQKILADEGYQQIEILHDHNDHPNGPLIQIKATTNPTW